MPRQERQVRSRSLVASAKSYGTKRGRAKAGDSKRPGEEWQRAAWDFYDMIPEYHQGCAITGALISRARLTVMEREDVDGRPTWKPTTNPYATAALEELYGGPEGQAEMLRSLGVHFSVAGEGWLIAPPGGGDMDDWRIAAATELTRTGGAWKLNGKELDTDMVIRLWKSHPRDHSKADAPTRAVLPVLSELHQLTKRIAAQIDSRLAGAGILLLPSETDFPAGPARQLNVGDPATTRDSVQAGDAQGMADLIAEVAEIAIQNPESAEAMIPIIATAPGEHISKAKLLTFWSELDKMAPKLREELIRRIALGLDIPPEVLLGHAGSNHWNAWLSDENSVKIHAEPLLKIITTSLTSEYLRKAIDGLVEDPMRFSIQADTSQMRLRPNRSKEALELHDRLILSAAATARENGFEDADLMSDEERQIALIRKVASGSTTPELVEAALRESGVDLDVQVLDRRDPAEARPTPSLLQHPVRELPQQSSSSAAQVIGLTMAAEQMVDRALQRAGNRMKTKMGIRNSPFSANRLYMGVQMTAGDMDAALEDAWGSCEEFDYGVDPVTLARTLDLYTRSVMSAQREPSRTGLAAVLKLMLDSNAA
jgi:hypothetical protein